MEGSVGPVSSYERQNGFLDGSPDHFDLVGVVPHRIGFQNRRLSAQK